VVNIVFNFFLYLTTALKPRLQPAERFLKNCLQSDYGWKDEVTGEKLFFEMVEISHRGICSTPKNSGFLTIV
jgi:hypothetical protein